MPLTAQDFSDIRNAIRFSDYPNYGDVYFVDSGHSAASTSGGKTPDQPASTLDTAVGHCTANNGDVILVAPGHSETKSATGALATLDVAGITIIGMGSGNSRPLFTFDHTGADIPVSAADVHIDNCRFLCSVADQTHVFDVTAARFKITNCEVRDDAAADNFVDFIDCSSTTDNNADGLTIVGLDVLSDDTGNDSLVEVNADLDDLHISDCKLRMGVAGEAIVGVATGKDLTNVYFGRNSIYRLNTTSPLLMDPDTTDANTGLVEFNSIGHADTATETLAPVTCQFRYIENYATAADDSSGYILPDVDS